ncbi:MAG TPA: DUF4397 domain-containing protein [Acidimicrobiales bacterium]|nr:DUF4397 domain-containing protein [Acidimicrobiales bacterium]
MTDARSTRPGGRRTAVVAIVAALLGVAGSVAWSGRPASAAATDVQLRVAHFSPDTPPMDVYATGFDGREQLVLPKLGYGQVSEYLPLTAGQYAFSMRPAGSPAADEAVLRVSAELAAGTSYTFAAFGRQAELETDLLTDDLSAPPAGQGRVRLIQAAIDAGAVDVSAADGPLFARDAELGSVGSYVAVPAGSWEVTARGEEGEPVVERLTVEPGVVSSLVVLDGDSAGDLEIMSVTDASAATAPTGGSPSGAPAGGVDTGGGGLAAGGAGPATTGGRDTGSEGAGPLLATSVGALAVLLGVGLVPVVRRRGRPV